VIIITDGHPGVGEGSLRQSVDYYAGRVGCADSLHHDKSTFPFRFSSKLHVACIASVTDTSYISGAPLYRQLISINGQGGELFVPDGPLTVASVRQMFTRLGEKYYTPFIGSLTCGNLRCAVHVLPPLEQYDR